MKLPLTFVAPLCVLAAASSALSATCAQGPYRAGCVGPNGAAIAHRPTATTMVRPPVASAQTVHCASGVYHAGCAGPHGAVVTPKTPHCYWRNGVKVCS